MMSEIGNFISSHPAELAFGISVLLFGWGVRQYVKARRWKSAEFTLAELEHFPETTYAQLVFSMLNYNELQLDFEYGDENYSIAMNDKTLAWTLRPHETDANFSPEELAVRDNFERFFRDIDRFDYLVTMGLMKREDLRSTLFYWLSILGNRKKGARKPEALVQAFYNYLQYYKHTGTIRMLRNFGFWGYYDKSLKYEAPAEGGN